MELLYIWIEDYKNIKRQGFNLSPRWRFDYDPENGQLEVEDRNNEAFDNFFWDDIINVTAIVGKNGSGKSRLLHEIGMGLSGHMSSYRGKEYIVIIKHLEKQEIQILTKIELELIGDFDKYKMIIDGRREPDFEAYSLLYSNHFDYISSSEIGNYDKHFSSISSVKLFTHFQDIMSSHRVAPGYRAFSCHPDVYAALYKFEQTNQVLFWFRFRKDFEKFGFLPKYISITGIMRSFPIFSTSLLPSLKSSHEKKFMVWLIARMILAFNNHINLNLDYVSKSHEYENFIKNTIQELNKHDNSQCQAAVELIYQLREYVEDGTFICEGNFVKASININTHAAELKVILDIYIRTVFKTSVDAKNYEDYYLDFMWGRKLHQFSTGEQYLISFLSRMYYQSKTIAEKNIILLLDEVETGFHPAWQKNYLNILHHFLPKIFCRDVNGNSNGKKIQIIISSHSPFVVSDLPNGNIIFLDKDDEGYCKVIDSLKDKKQTFGANIHTLLTDSFFMDGLVGDFAEQKINDVIKFLDNKPQDSITNPEQAEAIIKIIGEPILKKYLQKRIDSRKLNKVYDNEKRIALLEDELKKLRNKPDND